MSLADAKLALYEVFCVDTETGTPVSELAECVDATYCGEPRPGAMNGPVALSVLSIGVTALDYRFAVTLYSKPDTDAVLSQDRLDAAIDIIETLMDAATTWNRGDWQIAYNAELDVMAASLTTTCGREDFGASQSGQ
jgi:hypothetical protein